MIGVGDDADPGELIGKLRRALRAERNKARSGHWTYDLNRHIALRQAYLAETERMQGGGRAPPSPLRATQTPDRF
jgi:hypothetical protein